MKIEQQNLAWACLPKEERHKIISVYACKNDSNTHYNDGYRDALRQLYGHHNLTSDTEPEEMLMAKANDVREFYENGQFLKGYKETKPTGELITSWMVKLFGDKCLPDKEPSVQGEAKFSKGITVKIVDNRVKTFGNIATITHCEVDEGKVFYWLNDDIGCYMENQLEPYTEPETKDNMEEKELNRKALYDALCELESASVKVRKALISLKQ